MPCSSELPNEAYYKAQAEADKATRVACELWRILESENYTTASLSKESAKFIKRHLEWDERRKKMKHIQRKREKLKKKALAKLTPKEKRALGLK